MSTLSNNTANGTGGGLSVSANSAQVVMEGGCIWDNNTARSDGGALLIAANSLPDDLSDAAASSVVIAGGSKLRGNRASNGGAVYINGFADLNVSEGSSISFNSAEYDGGAAVFTQLPPSFHLESCDILGNSAARGSGGAFYLSTVVPWTPKKAADGCPVVCALPRLSSLPSIMLLNITDASVANNTARAANGGAFYVKPHETCCAGTTISFGVVASRFTGNKAMGAGGAIAMYDASNATATVSINGSRFSGNTAGIVSGDFKNIVNFGGAITIWREPADLALDLTTLCQLSAADTSFEANECNGGSGGAVTLIACSANFTRCSFTANRATLSGGAIAALHVPRTTATLGLTTSGFLDSSPAGGDSAGQSQSGLGRRRVLSRIAAPTARQLQTWPAWESVSDSSRPDGSRLAPSAARRKLWDSFPWDDFGSGCAASRHWSVSLLDCNFLSNNAALEFGGALYLYASSDGGHVQIDRNNFTENKALSQHAGAVFLAARGAGTSVQLTNSVFGGNAASAASAGALYVLLGMLACGELANVSLSRNSAATSGGACVLDIRSTGALVVDNVTAVKNSALAGDGGALKLQVQTGSAALLRGCGFSDNKAAGNGGAALLDGNCRSYLSLRNTRMARNWAGLSGGGLYASYAARTAPTTDGSAFGSSPAAVYSAAAPCPPDDTPDESGEWHHMSVQLADFRDNEAGQQGGAIFVAPASTVTLTNATMDNNMACTGGGSLAAQSCSALALRHSTLHNSATTGSGGGFYASGCRRILFEFVDVAGNEAACSGGGLLVTGGEVTSIGGSSSTASDFVNYTSALLHRVRVTGNAAGSKSGRADGSCGADKAPRQQSWRAGAGGGLFINGSVVAVLSRSNLTEQNDALFGHQIATAQRCYPRNAAASPSAGNKIFDPPEVKDWDRAWAELDGLASRQCWVLQLSDSLVPPVVDTRATQDLPIWAEDFLASALHARCSSEYQFQAQFDNEAIDDTIRNVVRDRLRETRGRVLSSTGFLAGQTLSYVSNGAISASADVMEPLKAQRVRDIANQLDECVLRPASFNLTDVNDLLRNSSYIGLPATYIGLMAFENPDVTGQPVHLKLQTGVSFNLTAQLYDTLQHKFTSDIGPSTVTLALRPRPLDDGPYSAAAADGSVPWLYEDIANLDPGLNRSLTVPVINGSATWSGVKAYAWPGNYSLVLSTYVESSIKVAPLEVKVEILPCAVGQTLDRSHNSYKESWTGCSSCASGQYGLWADNRLPLTKITVAGADHGDGALAGDDSGGDGRGSGGSAARSLQRFLTKMNDTLKASDDSCKTCPSNALCLGGAVIVPEQGYWHSAANSTQIHSCPNPSACSSPKDDGPREFPRWLDERMGTQWDRRTKLLAWCQLTWYSSVVPGADITAAYYSAYPPPLLPVSNASAVAGVDRNATALAVLLNRDASLWGKQTASEAEFNCLLFGLAPGHPDSYMQQLCLEGYTGNLCASCVAGYYVDSDFNCKRCPELARTITLGLISFFSSVILVLITTMTNLTEGFGEKKAKQQQQQQEVQVQQVQTREPRDPVELGDVVKVIVLHFQYLIIVTRLSVDYPSIIVRCQAVFSTITGAENYIVYSPSCLKPESDSGGQALIQWLAGILTPCAVAVVSMLLWTLRYGYPLRKVAGESLGNRLLSVWAAMRGAYRAAATWREGRHLQNSRSDVQSVCGSEGSAVVLSSSKHLVAYDPTSMPSPFTISGGGPVLKDTSSLPFPEAQEGGIGLCTVFSRDIHVVAFDGADTIGTPAEAAAPIAGATAMVSLATPASPTDPTEAAPPQAPALPTAASAALVVDLDGVVGGCPAKAPEPPAPDGSAACDSDQAAAALHASHAHALDVSVIPEDPLSDMPDILRAGGDEAAFRNPASAAAAPPPLLGSAGSGTHIPADGIRLRSAPTTVLSSAAAYGGGGGPGGYGGSPAQQVAYYRNPYSESWHRKTPRTLSAHMRSAAINEAAFKTLHKLRTLAVSTQQSSQATFHQVDKAMSLREQLGVVLMAAVFILYPSWANAALSTFACYPIDDGKGPFPQGQQATWRQGYWVRDMQTQCYSGTHLHVYVPIGVAAVLVFCLLPPLASFMFVWRVRNRLEDTHVRKVYGFLYKRYKPRYIWWETALQLETLVLVTVEVLGRGLSVSYQALLLLAVFIFIALFNVSCAPLVSQLLVIMEYMSLGTLSLTITLSLYFTVDDGLNPAAQNMLAILIITLNVCLLVYFLYVASRHFWPSAVKKVAPKAQAVLRKLSSIGSSAGNNHSHNPQQHLRKPPHAADSDSSEGGGSRFCWPLLGRFAVWRGNDAATGSSEVDGGRAASTSSETLDAAGRHVLERSSDEFSDSLSGPADSELVQLAFAGSKGLDIARASVCLDDRLSSYSTEMASRVADYPKPNTSHVCIQLEEGNGSGGNGAGGGFYPRI
ncbi:hypothetical protein PLESTM_001257500 [Pleodorina starrii]|nr:hypothetical protein PLESTM_001257500 [Pleodorina starrii]